MFTRRRVSDEARLEVNTFLQCPTPGRPASSSRTSTHGRAMSMGSDCHRSTGKQAHLGTRGLSDPPRCLRGSQPSRPACLSPRLFTWSKQKSSPIMGWWHWQHTWHWGQSEENPSRCQLPSWRRVGGGSIYYRKDKLTPALVCKQDERRGGYWAVVICCLSKTQTEAHPAKTKGEEEGAL